MPLQWWRDSGVPGWFGDQLGLDYQGISGLPENWIFNTGDENNPIRRLVSGFLSPLATSYVLVIVLLYLVARRRTWWTVTAGAIAYAGLLWTHTRAAYLALALGLVVLAVAQRRFLPVALAVASLVIGVGFVKAFPHIGPSTSYTQTELDYLREQGAAESRASATIRSARAMPRPRATSATSATASAPSIHHPLGFGLGNAGVSASRTGVEIKAGESTYTELGVEIGVAGLAVFLAWMAAVLLALWRRSAWLSAAWVAMLAIGIQTDVIGVHWIAYVLFALAGAAVGGGLPDDDDRRPMRRASRHEGPRRTHRSLPRRRAPRRVRARDRDLPHAALRRQHGRDDRLHVRRGRLPRRRGRRLRARPPFRQFPWTSLS